MARKLAQTIVSVLVTLLAFIPIPAAAEDLYKPIPVR